MSQATHTHSTTKPALTNNDAAALTKAFTHWQALSAEFERALDAADDLDEEFAVGDRYLEAIDDAAIALIDLPVVTMEGAHQKLTVVYAVLDQGGSRCGFEFRLLASVLSYIAGCTVTVEAYG